MCQSGLCKFGSSYLTFKKRKMKNAVFAKLSKGGAANPGRLNPATQPPGELALTPPVGGR